MDVRRLELRRDLEGSVIGGRIGALTVQQPWASAIAEGIKRIECRPFPPPSLNQPGRWIGIHVGRSNKYLRYRALLVGRWPRVPSMEDMEASFGHIIAVVHIAAVVSGSAPEVTSDPWATMPAAGSHAWVFDDVVVLPRAIPHTGQQRVWWVGQAESAEIISAVLAARPLDSMLPMPYLPHVSMALHAPTPPSVLTSSWFAAAGAPSSSSSTTLSTSASLGPFGVSPSQYAHHHHHHAYEIKADPSSSASSSMASMAMGPFAVGHSAGAGAPSWSVGAPRAGPVGVSPASATSSGYPFAAVAAASMPFPFSTQTSAGMPDVLTLLERAGVPASVFTSRFAAAPPGPTLPAPHTSGSSHRDAAHPTHPTHPVHTSQAAPASSSSSAAAAAAAAVAAAQQSLAAAAQQQHGDFSLYAQQQFLHAYGAHAHPHRHAHLQPSSLAGVGSDDGASLSGAHAPLSMISGHSMSGGGGSGGGFGGVRSRAGDESGFHDERPHYAPRMQAPSMQASSSSVSSTVAAAAAASATAAAAAAAATMAMMATTSAGLKEGGAAVFTTPISLGLDARLVRPGGASELHGAERGGREQAGGSAMSGVVAVLQIPGSDPIPLTNAQIARLTSELQALPQSAVRSDVIRLLSPLPYASADDCFAPLHQDVSNGSSSSSGGAGGLGSGSGDLSARGSESKSSFRSDDLTHDPDADRLRGVHAALTHAAAALTAPPAALAAPTASAVQPPPARPPAAAAAAAVSGRPARNGNGHGGGNGGNVGNGGNGGNGASHDVDSESVSSMGIGALMRNMVASEDRSGGSESGGTSESPEGEENGAGAAQKPSKEASSQAASSQTGSNSDPRPEGADAFSPHLHLHHAHHHAQDADAAPAGSERERVERGLQMRTPQTLDEMIIASHRYARHHHHPHQHQHHQHPSQHPHQQHPPQLPPHTQFPPDYALPHQSAAPGVPVTPATTPAATPVAPPDAMSAADAAAAPASSAQLPVPPLPALPSHPAHPALPLLSALHTAKLSSSSGSLPTTTPLDDRAPLASTSSAASSSAASSGGQSHSAFAHRPPSPSPALSPPVLSAGIKRSRDAGDGAAGGGETPQTLAESDPKRARS